MIILHRKEGERTSLEVLNHIFLGGVARMGYAFIDKKKGLSFQTDITNATAGGVAGIQDKLGAAMSYAFTPTEGKDWLKEDWQPYELLNSQGPVAVGFFEGDFGKPPTDSAHTAAYHASKKLSKHLSLIYNASSGDAEKLAEAMEDENFSETINDLIASDGSIVIVLRNGKSIRFAKGERFVNDATGFYAPPFTVAGATEDAAADDENPLDFSNPDASAEDDATLDFSTPTGPVGDDRTHPHEAGANGPAGPASEITLEVLYTEHPWSKGCTTKAALFTAAPKRYPNASCKNKKALEHWYEATNYTGGIPEKFSEAYKEFAVKCNIKSQSDREKFIKLLPPIVDKKTWGLINQIHDFLKKSGKATDLSQTADIKTLVPDATKNGVTKIGTIRESVVFSSQAAQKAIETAKKYLDKGSTVIPDPKTSTQEKAVVQLPEKLGLESWRNLYTQPMEFWAHFATDPATAALVMFQAMQHARKTDQLEDEEETLDFSAKAS